MVKPKAPQLAFDPATETKNAFLIRLQTAGARYADEVLAYQKDRWPAREAKDVRALCLMCGQPIPPTNADKARPRAGAKYCGPACRMKASRAHRHNL